MQKKQTLNYVIVKTDEISFPFGYSEVLILEQDSIELLETTKFKFKNEDRLVIVYAEDVYTEEVKFLQRGLYIKPLDAKEVMYQGEKALILTFKALHFFDIQNFSYEMNQDEIMSANFLVDGNAKGTVGYEMVLSGHINNVEDVKENLMNEFRQDQNKMNFFSIFETLVNNSNSFGISTNNQAGTAMLFKQNYGAKDEVKPYDIEEIKALIDSKITQDNDPSEFLLNNFESLMTYFGFLDLNKFPHKWHLYNSFDYGNFTRLINEVGNFIQTALKLEENITSEISKKLNNQQKEFMLREKRKVIDDELAKLGKDILQDDKDEYVKRLKNKTLKKMYPDSIKEIIRDETKRYSEMMQASPEANLVKNYVEYLKKLPWRKVSKDRLDIKYAREVLEKYHYGIKEVKERILEHLGVLINAQTYNKNYKNEVVSIDENYEIDLNLFKDKPSEKAVFNNVPIIALVGPPGTGKTTLAKAISEALNKKYVKISLGGVKDESEIRGHRRTYVGAMPGKIVKGVAKAGVSNAVFLLDEIDKMASDHKGDPASAMLEVLDPEQNAQFQDHYLEQEYDLSKIIFIATANYFQNIPEALIDRVEVIELDPYTLNEKVQIAQKHLIPKVINEVYLDEKLFNISEETLRFIINRYTREAGVRGLKRILDKIARKIVIKRVLEPDLKSFDISLNNLEELLGAAPYKTDEDKHDEIPGIATGLAYSTHGGSDLEIEVNVFKSEKGGIQLTGSLKDVMKESAQIALTYVRSNAKYFGIHSFDFDKHTIHIHVPEGATPKDGPSAGVTFTTAIISALTRLPVPNNYAMTGEITLQGKVLPIGGLKEKSFAAYWKKIKYVFIPHANIDNLQKIPDEIKREITYIPVKRYNEIFQILFRDQKPENTITFN
ncbi:endopeptidase La [Mycoplasmopsis synoviae]|uniref:endopeptidase La n=3 Tax=Mycoplasmopsis synoviae TaxID=2109 RepID=G3F4J2_MYCSY|nr:endopeptidase La [Mycoplasmopsis synoviae]AEN02417.1 heat shock ATP-dependent protease [Mycoplasmopsis synoviae]AEN02422.1 heat shock ATP-dependent protease [Mycoplasmopsis synoviae]AKB11052.1 ATPase AAA [Mycoplasmopsis synoviae ATCC 25204]